MAEKSLGYYDQNTFARWLFEHHPGETVEGVLREYQVGTVTKGHYAGCTIFWQLDQKGRYRSGKVLRYKPDGHRQKGVITWAHSLLKLPDFQLQQCLFGEHFLTQHPNKPIGIVESEKAAILMTLHFSHWLWLATGGLNNLTEDKLAPLADRQVVLFPDSGCEAKWAEKAPGYPVSDLLAVLGDGSDLGDWV